MDIHEIDQAYRIKLRDQDDRKTYAKFMKQGGKRAFEKHKFDSIDDREEYKNKMKYGKSGR